MASTDTRAAASRTGGIRLVNGHLRYPGEPTLFSGLSLELSGGDGAGRIYGLVGVNGVGKTSLLEMLAGRRLTPPSQLISERDGYAEYLSHPPMVLEHLTVRQNIHLYGRIHALCSRFSSDRADTAATLLGLDPKMDHRADCLSSGERQRMCIARALAISARTLLLDEPATNLDPLAKRELLLALADAARREDLLVVATSQEPREMLLIADELFLMFPGAGAPSSVSSFVPRGHWPLMPSREAARLFATPGAAEFRRLEDGRFQHHRLSHVVADYPGTPPPGATGVFAELRFGSTTTADANHGRTGVYVFLSSPGETGLLPARVTAEAEGSRTAPPWLLSTDSAVFFS
jgi:ABC-type nitrate/sulfonate/bicarbonate transport system ATPase subunit